MSEQINLFGIRECDTGCKRTATVIQQTFFNGEEHYCKTCYDKMIAEKERKAQEERV